MRMAGTFSWKTDAVLLLQKSSRDHDNRLTFDIWSLYLILSIFCIFTVLLYVRAWIQVLLAAHSPMQDLELLKASTNYLYKTITEATVSKLLLHLWYLSEQFVGFALFDPSVSLATKKSIAVAILNKENNKTEIKRPHIKAQFVLTLSLQDFCSKRSASCFTKMGLPCSFLSHESETWNSNAEYQKTFSVQKKFEVVNDNAERGIALITVDLWCLMKISIRTAKNQLCKKRSKENNQQS